MTSTDQHVPTDRDTQRLVAGRAVVARILADEVAALTRDARAVLEPGMEPDEDVAATLPDGTRVGKVGRSKPSRRVIVTDQAALLAWATEHRPDDVIVHRSINPAVMKAWEGQVRKHGHAFDPATGEIVPGIEPAEGSPSFRVTVDEDMRDVVFDQLAALIAAGGLLPVLPATSDGGAA